MNATTAASPTTHGITGYRSLSQEEKDLMNAVKAHGEATKSLIERIAAFHVHEVESFDHKAATNEERMQHQYLISESQHFRIRATDEIKVGLMLLNRSIARPTTFA